MAKSSAISKKNAEELNIYRGSLQNIVKRDLRFSSFKRRKVQFLPDQIKMKRL